MAKIRIVGDSSGYVELAAPNAAGNNTLELPSNATKLVGADASNSLNVTGIATFSGGIVVSAGSTSAPSISPSGDSNTGIFFPSADTVCIGEGGSEALRVNSSGYVGVGTNNPASTLDVGGEITIRRTAAGNEGGQINFARASDNAVAWNIDAYGSTSTPSLRFIDNTAAVVRMEIDGSGRVTMPYQPAFMVRGDETGSKAENTKFAFTSTASSGAINTRVTFDRLGNWSDANDRFTAPVAGAYHFYFGLYRQSATSSYFSVAPRVNGSQLANGDIFIFFTAATGETGNSDDGMYGTFTFNLAANDYVELFMRGGANTITIYGGHSFFGGHLIG